MSCKNCGAQLDEGTKFCANCGTKVENDQVNEVPTVDESSVSSVEPAEAFSTEVENVESKVLENVESKVEPTMENVEPKVEPTIDVPNTSDGISTNEKSSKSFVGPIIGIIAVLLIVGGIYCYFNNKNRAVKNLINNAYDKFDSLTVENDFNIEEQSILINGDLIITTNIPELADLSGEKLNYTIGMDYPNKKFEMGASLEENGLKIIDAAMYLIDNSAYISLKDDFDKLIKVDVDGLDEIFKSTSTSTLTEDDIKYITKAYRDILIDSIKGNDFDKSSATITLDGVDTKVTKLSYNLTSERAIKLVNNIIDGTLKDSKLLGILAKATGSTVDEIKSELQSSKITDTTSTDSSSVNFDIYTKGFNNTFVGMDIQGIIQIRKNSDNVTIEAGMGTEKISLVIKNLGDNSCVIELNSNIGGEVIKGSLSMSGKEVSTNNYEGSVIFSLTVGDASLNLTSNYKEVIGADIANVDVSGAIDSESLTEEDANKIYQSVGTKLMDSKLYKLIESIESSRSYDYDYDYDYDFSDYNFDDLDYSSLEF